MNSTPSHPTPDAKTLQEREEQLRLAIEAADVGLWDVDVATGTLYWPAIVKAMFGISAQAEVTLDDFVACLHPDDAPEVLRAFAAAQDPEVRTVYDVEYRAIGKEDGRVRWLAAKGRGLFDASGRCVRAIGTVIDITERKQAESLQQEIQRRLQVLDRIEHATRPLVDAVDVMQVTAQLLGEHLGATRCAYADVEPDNDRFTIRSDWSLPGVPSSAGVYSLDLFGPQATSNLRNGRHLVVHDVDRELGDDQGGRMFNAIGIKAIVCAGLVKGGRLVAMMAVHQSTPRRWSDGDLRVITEVVDRSWAHIERVRDAAMLREQDRRKDEFLATLAHELRNPIAPMLYAITLLKRDTDASRQARRHEVIERQANHLVRLVEDLLDVSRINRGLIELKQEVTDIAPLLEQAVEAATPWLEAAGHRFSMQLPGQSAPVHADPARLVQVVTNLLNNAAKYTPDGGDIRLSARVDGARVIVELADNGMGIPPQDQGRLFQLFTQLSHTGRKAHGGLGIGLSLVKSLVEMHAGTVSVESAGIGQGSTFRIELPLVAAVAEPEAPGQAPAAPSHGRVLVVEDNPDGLLTLVELIKVEGHAVMGAPGGLEALRIASEWKPDLVLLDLGMPLMDGYEVAARLRGDPATAGTRIVALSGWGTQQDRAKTTAAGFDAHLTKPVEPEELLNRIGEWMSPEAVAGRRHAGQAGLPR
ncbi:hybrid sensor histidine kinase/response regulator [Paracidovorax valerianellae]|uniref:histidine kinase n=1 Tax=Paracidovorax valerianellae TaxID=187868 RepID=A0A1G7EA80_9BURK|nr:hybrid sensor histidine kinase/response regulator [Paracidovorax valerianellae]MDA8447413.1 ATP-binding protein [Paracidovorax valerianellae]SDE60624.1 PAS domain S-box-containing protein [Paracidovorax valerianellae]